MAARRPSSRCLGLCHSMVAPKDSRRNGLHGRQKRKAGGASPIPRFCHSRTSIAPSSVTDCIALSGSAGFAIWASTSEAVDRLSIREQIKIGTFLIRLNPEDWNSCPINWLLDVIAPARPARHSDPPPLASGLAQCENGITADDYSGNRSSELRFLSIPHVRRIN